MLTQRDALPAPIAILSKFHQLLMSSGLWQSAVTFEDVFYSCPPVAIKLAMQPPALGGTIQEVPLHIFSEQERIHFTSSVKVSRVLRDMLWLNKEYAQLPRPEIEHLLHHPRNDLILADMGHGVGKGVFLDPSKPAIIKGTVVAVYEGIIDDRLVGKFESENDYSTYFDNDNPPEDNIISKHFQASCFGIHAGTYRGICAYFQDIIGDCELKNTTGLTEQQKKHIPTANLIPITTLHYGCPVICLMATRDILPGEHIGWTYGTSYWSTREKADGMHRKLFSHQGQLIGEVRNNNIHILPTVNLTSLPTNKQNDISTLQRFLRLAGASQPLDPATQFIANCLYTLNIYHSRNVENKSVHAFISELIQAVKSSADASDAYKKVKGIWDAKESYQPFVEVVSNLKKEMIKHMRQYNSRLVQCAKPVLSPCRLKI